MTFIDNKRVTCDNYGNLIEQVFYDDVHLNNKIGTKKLVTNIKHHLVIWKVKRPAFIITVAVLLIMS